MFAIAQKILGYDLLSLCLEGPEEELMKTVHCQPAVFVTSLAAVERLNHENPKAGRLVEKSAHFSSVLSLDSQIFFICKLWTNAETAERLTMTV